MIDKIHSPTGVPPSSKSTENIILRLDMVGSELFKLQRAPITPLSSSTENPTKDIVNDGQESGTAGAAWSMQGPRTIGSCTRVTDPPCGRLGCPKHSGARILWNLCIRHAKPSLILFTWLTQRPFFWNFELVTLQAFHIHLVSSDIVLESHAVFAAEGHILQKKSALCMLDELYLFS